MVCIHAFAASKALAPCSRHVRRQGRGSAVTVRAEDKLARNVISLPKRPGEVQVEGESQVTYLGAGGQQVSVRCKKVCQMCGFH